MPTCSRSIQYLLLLLLLVETAKEKKTGGQMLAVDSRHKPTGTSSDAC